MAEVSARPENLKKFVKAASGIRTDLSKRISSLRASYDAYQQSGSPYIGNPDLLDRAIPTWLIKLSNDETFVQLVAMAFEQADSGGGKVTMNDAAFTSAFNSVLAANHITPDMLNALDGAITVDNAIAAGIPRTSGFVADPVCTATGHFLETEDDFVWPSRLEVLRWTRTYSSRFVASGPFGRGWASWATTRCEQLADGSLIYCGPDGQLAIVPAGSSRIAGLEATLERTDAGGVTITWDIHSGRPGQCWTFPADGTLGTVAGPMVGTTAFRYTGGLLTGLIHDGGRRLEIEWDLDLARITAVQSSCGRRAEYRYNDAGDLVSTGRMLGDRHYDVDDRGRIVAVFDADGVRLCHNTYDDEGRIVRQISPFGRETVFRYLTGRRTVVSDTTDGPVTMYRHDVTGRLVGLTNDLGQHMERVFDDHGRCVSSRGFDGTLVTQSFDPDGKLAGLEGPGGYREAWEHDDAGRVLSHTDSSGARMTFAYEGDDAFPTRIEGSDDWALGLSIDNGHLRSMTDADGVSIHLDHDPDGNVIAVVNGVGDVTRYTHHPSGEAATVVTADGAEFRFDRDDAGRLIAMHAPTGDVWRVEYTAAGRRVALIEPNGARIAYEYAAHGGIERITDPTGAAIEMRHDHLEQLAGLTMADGAKWELSYGAMGQLAMITDPTGASWLYDHDAEGRLTAATDPLGHRVRQGYDTAGWLTSLIDRSGNVTRYTHDALGQLTSIEDPTGATTTIERDQWGRVLTIEDGDGNRVRYRYTPAGRIESITSGAGRTVTCSYDAAGRLITVSDGSGATTGYEWDACDRVVATTDAEGRTRRTTYDAMGRAITTSIGNRTWTSTFDHAGRVTSITDPIGGVSRYRYDVRGKPVAATDPLGNTVQWRYDARGNAVGVIDPLGGTSTSTFDAMRRPVATTDQAGRVTRAERDAAGRVTARVLATGERREYRLDARGLVMDVLVDGQNLVVYERDRVGRPVLVHEPVVNRTYALTWSRGGRLTRIDLDGATHLAWEFDGDGRMTSRTVRGSDRVSFRYDAAGRVREVSGEWSGTTTIDRDRTGRVKGVRGPGVDRQWDLDAGGLVARCRDGSSVTEYVRNDAGLVVEARTGTEVVRYGYDIAGQMVSAIGPDGAWTWRYDAAGRLAHEEGPSGARTFLYDDVHQLVRVDGSDGTVVFTYDAAGRRITERAGRGWAGRASASEPDGDGVWGRSHQGEAERGSGGTTRYRWDGLGRLAEIDRNGGTIRLDIDSFGTLVRAGDTNLLWDPTSRVPELLAIDGTPMASAFGQPLVAGEPAADPWRAKPSGAFEIDGLLWLHHRCYDPFTRQFLSPDPLPGVAATPTAANPYHYGFNNPVAFVDPLGLRPLTIDEYNEIRERETGPQWGTIAMLGLTAASFLIPGVGPIAAIAIGAGMGAVMGAAPGVINGITTGQWDWGQIVKGGVIGGVVGAAGGRFLPGSTGLVNAMVRGGAVGLGGGTASELWDMTPLPGSDGRFDLENVALSTAFGAGGAGIGYGYSAARSTTVYRFHDASDPNSLLPRVASSDPATQTRVANQLRDPAVRTQMAEDHMQGYVQDSPFVSVTTDPVAAAKSTDPWLRTIATGSPGSPGAARAPELSTFRVPNSKLIAPQPNNALSISEGERLFVGPHLDRYRISTEPNPF